jgi:hypothetical protein
MSVLKWDFTAPFVPDNKDDFQLRKNHPLPCDQAVGFRTDTHEYYYKPTDGRLYFASTGVTTFLKQYSNSTFESLSDSIASQTVDSINKRMYSYITKNLFVTPTVAKKARLSPAELKDQDEKKTKYEKYFPPGTFEALRVAYAQEEFDLNSKSNYEKFVSLFFEQLKNPKNEYVLRDPAKRAEWKALEPKTTEAFVHIFPTLNRLRLPLVMTNEDLAGTRAESGAWARAGSHVHHEIELYLNNKAADRPEVRDQNHFKEFLKFHAKTEVQGWKIFRTELSIFSSALNICGQIDALYSKDDALEIVDWKTSSDKVPQNAFANSEFKKNKDDPIPRMKAPLQAFPQSKRFEYFLQMNVYKRMLCEEKVGNLGAAFDGVRDSRMVLVFLYDGGDYDAIEVPDLSNETQVQAWLQDQDQPDAAETARQMVGGFMEILRRRRQEYEQIAEVVRQIADLPESIKNQL